jgi:hypothetical protein
MDIIYFMKKIIFVLLVALSSPSHADWDLIYKDTQKKTEYFLNLADTVSQKEKIRAWTLESFSQPEKAGSLEYLSVKSFVEFDCQASKLRILAYSLYGSNMGKGKTIFSKGSPMEWAVINDNTVYSAYSQIVCAESISD